ncbi:MULTISPECIES: hypothetical protein [Acinetobacter]|uniref:Uncharacterized protein n=1 Tax=Acinetobacter indicus TaxID=756892 RepID=A0A6C0Y6B5_9GAMM|nr:MULTISPECIES: hypothetical protein [Acinetobacter]QIC71689.1 hypothetical protein FSC09_14940 [Acinetobacter indicus]QKQ71598.1 hypothetical protein E5Y90_15305 [Acinetobacter sp. 10FS3-1]
MTTEDKKYAPLSYVLLKEFSAEPFIAQVSVDAQTLILSNRVNLSQILAVDEVIETPLGSRTDWLTKYPLTYRALAKFITEVEGTDLKIENQALSERAADIKATDSLLQIRALHFLSTRHNAELIAAEKKVQESISVALIESAVLYALQNDDLICDLHSHFTTLYHKAQREEAETFSFDLTE